VALLFGVLGGILAHMILNGLAKTPA